MAHPATAPSADSSPFGDSAVGRLFSEKRAYAATRVPEFRALLESSNNAAVKCKDEMLCRFIESNTAVRNMEIRGANLQSAADNIAATMRWRAEFGVDQLKSCATCDVDPFAHCFFSIGRDRRGWELAYSCAGRTTTKDPTTITRHLVAWLEETFERRTDAPTHLCLLLDLHGFGVGDLDPRVALRCIGILLTHYPDRVGQVGILDAPWVFSAVLAVLKTGIDPLSQQKLIMLTRGSVSDDYFGKFLTEAQSAFVRDMLSIRARPAWASFSPLAAGVRVSLGPCDAFCRKVRRKHAKEEPGEAESGGRGESGEEQGATTVGNARGGASPSELEA